MKMFENIIREMARRMDMNELGSLVILNQDEDSVVVSSIHINGELITACILE